MRELKFKLVKDGKLQGVVELKSGGIIAPAYEWDTAYQFIGRVDKNNREIFEGDITRHYLYGIGTIEFGEEENDGGGDNSAVFYGYYYKSLRANGCYGKPHIQSYELDKDIEVIGTVWENPELLKEK